MFYGAVRDGCAYQYPIVLFTGVHLFNHCYVNCRYDLGDRRKWLP